MPDLRFKRDEFHFGGLDLHYRMPEMGFLSCEIERDNRDSKKKQIRMENEDPLILKFRNKSNIALQLPSWFRKLPTVLCAPAPRKGPWETMHS